MNTTLTFAVDLKKADPAKVAELARQAIAVCMTQLGEPIEPDEVQTIEVQKPTNRFCVAKPEVRQELGVWHELVVESDAPINSYPAPKLLSFVQAQKEQERLQEEESTASYLLELIRFKDTI